MNIDLGGGLCPLPDYENLDPVHGEGIWKRRLEEGIPAADGSVQSAHASHVLEHVAVADRISVFNEVWRVLETSGEFEIRLPLLLTEDGAVHWEAIADPTHVSFWCKDSFEYFTGGRTAQADYGIRRWDWVSWEVCGGWEGHAVLAKPHWRALRPC